MGANFALLYLVAFPKHVEFNYEPVWQNDATGHKYLSVLFRKPLTDAPYFYHIISDNIDYGMHPAPVPAPDGSHTIDFNQLKAGGFSKDVGIQVFLVEPDTVNQCLVAFWN